MNKESWRKNWNNKVKPELEKEIEKGYINCRKKEYNGATLAILNYTKKAQFERKWNDYTRVCRGLVVNWETGEIVINSPEKFFNIGEQEAPNLDDWEGDPLSYCEKLDGYYISIRNDSKYGFIITSRGSFENQYVEAAKKLLPETIPPDTDFFCELCKNFPSDTGIIVTHWDKPKLVLWGYNDKIPLSADNGGWTGEVAGTISTQSLAEEYLKGRVEGIVVYNHKTKQRLKVKTNWYFLVHRIISGCTMKHVYEIVSGGGRIEGVSETVYTANDGTEQHFSIADIPEEHLTQMIAWERKITATIDNLLLVSFIEYLEYRRFEDGRKRCAIESNAPGEVRTLAIMFLAGNPMEKIIQTAFKLKKSELLRNSAN